MVLPLTALFVAMGIEWTNWGQGRFNWGPRVGALLILVMGQVAFRGTILGEWLRRGVDWLAHWADAAFTWALGGLAGDAISYLIHWLPAALLGAYWLAAMAPGRLFGERMTWRLAWTGLLLPTFLSAVPGPAGNLLETIITAAATLGAALINGLFALGGRAA
jgi:hypothetical protein